MKVEAITVCVEYDDFLKVAAPFNLPLLDRWIVVTRESDLRTRHVCRRFGIECILTEDGHKKAGEFCKGRMIERGLQHLSADAWRLQLDGDVVLPSHFRRSLEIADLQEDCIYGADRIMVRGWNDWLRLLASGYLNCGQHTYSHSVTFPKGLSIGSRWVSNLTGYVPIGFFQLWHSSTDEWSGIRTKPYPDKHNTACRGDVQHGLQWDRAKRALIPEIIVVHLESEAASNGTNWHGRKTRRFQAT